MSICTLYVRHQPGTSVPLLILSNRDEFTARATQPLHAWQDAPVLAGRDLKSGGTWLGLNPKTARFAAVLNVREGDRPAPTKALTRGELVTGFLQSELEPLEWLSGLTPSRYDGFNLIVGDLNQAYLFSNRGAGLASAHASGQASVSTGQTAASLSTGIDESAAMGHSIGEPFSHPISLMASNPDFAESSCFAITGNSAAISNGVLGSGPEAMHPNWFKSTWLFEQAQRLDATAVLSDPDQALPLTFEILKFSDQAPKALLPDTGVPKLLERQLSSLFIDLPGYGTQTSSVVAVSDQSYMIAERSHRQGVDATLRGHIG
jgi:uncharacterized protein with NRDE domain